MQTFTCWNYANVEVTWLQLYSWVMFWNSRLLLGSSNHTVQQLAEHSVSTHTYHSEWKKKIWLELLANFLKPKFRVLSVSLLGNIVTHISKMTFLVLRQHFWLNNKIQRAGLMWHELLQWHHCYCTLLNLFSCGNNHWRITYPSNPVKSFFRM